MEFHPQVHHQLLLSAVVHRVLASAHQIQWKEKSTNQKELRKEESKKKINEEQKRFEVIPVNCRVSTRVSSSICNSKV